MINIIGIGTPIIKAPESVGGTPPPASGFMLMETTGWILMEDYSRIILE